MSNYLSNLVTLQDFIGKAQRRTLIALCAPSNEEHLHFRDKIREYAQRILNMPCSANSGGDEADPIVYLHYFTAGADFFITERDQIDDDEEPSSRQCQAFGLADIFQDGGELGYINLFEILDAGAELDLYWTPKPLSAVRAERAHRSATTA